MRWGVINDGLRVAGGAPVDPYAFSCCIVWGACYSAAMHEETDADLKLVATRVTPEIQEGFRRLAEAQHRSVSAQLRRMIEEAVAVEPEDLAA